MEVSNNSLSVYRTCPKKWSWYYIHGLKPRKRQSSLVFGNVIHEAFDKYYKGESFDTIIKWVDAKYKDEMSTMPDEESEEFYIDSKMASGMLLNFPFKQLVFDEIQSELSFETQLYKGTKYLGRCDGLVKYNGHWFIREVKTTGESRTMFENRAKISSQATGYVWGIQRVTGKKIAGVLFDGLRKIRLYKKQTEDMYQFAERTYLAYCDAKDLDKNFFRFPTYRTQDDIDIWLEDTVLTSKHLQMAVNKLDFPRNTGNCYMFNRECPYLRVCKDKCPDQMVLDLLYEKREDANGQAGGSKEDPSESIST